MLSADAREPLVAWHVRSCAVACQKLKLELARHRAKHEGHGSKNHDQMLLQKCSADPFALIKIPNAYKLFQPNMHEHAQDLESCDKWDSLHHHSRELMHTSVRDRMRPLSNEMTWQPWVC